jgi:hypothetical protein
MLIKGSTKIVWSCNVIFHEAHSIDCATVEASETCLPRALAIPVDVDLPPIDCGAARVATELPDSVGGIPVDSVGEDELPAQGDSEVTEAVELDPSPGSSPSISLLYSRSLSLTQG